MLLIRNEASAPLRLVGAVLSFATMLSFAPPAAGQVKTFCSEPVTPFCVNRSEVYKDPVAKEACRREVKDYAAGLGRYSDCVRKQALEGEARAEAILERFACMERGGDDCR